MTDDEFEAFIEDSMNELRAKQSTLQTKHGMGTFARWHFDQATELLSFFDAQDRLALEAEVIDLGSHSTESSTWKWAWANESVLPSLRRKAEPLKQLHALTGIGFFGSESAVSVEDESMVWEIVAMSVRQLQALGAYRAPSSSGSLTSYLAITRVRPRPS